MIYLEPDIYRPDYATGAASGASGGARALRASAAALRRGFSARGRLPD